MIKQRRNSKLTAMANMTAFPIVVCVCVCVSVSAGFSSLLGAQPPQQPQNQPPAQFNMPQPGMQQVGAPPIQRALGGHQAIVQRPPNAIRIKDITKIEGHRSNRVSGVGLVTGLKGTGGKGTMTQDTARTMLRKFNILADEIEPGSMALVMVSAEIPAFTKQGETINATVSVMDGSSSLFGGILGTTFLKAMDNQPYATAGGPLIISGFSAGGAGGGVSKNHDTTGKARATVETSIDPGPAFPRNSYRLLLTNKDYRTAQRIADQINRLFPGHARAGDRGSVDVIFPRQYQQAKMEFVVLVNDLRVVPDIPARVVINEKTGTIIVGHQVKLSPVMFAIDNLVIATTEAPEVSQPAPLSEGTTEVVPRTQIAATETGGNYNLLQPQSTVGDLAAVLNQLRVSPRDMIGVFQAIQAAGALQGHLHIE